MLLGLSLLVCCAGCVSPQSPATPPATPTTGDPTVTQPTTITPGTGTVTTPTGYTTDCPYFLQVAVATDTQRSRTDRTLEYAELPPARQEEFEAALANGTVELGETLPEPWGSPRIVTYRDGQYYAVASTC